MMEVKDYIIAEEGKACLVDIYGNTLFELDVDVLYYPSHGLCQVKKDGKYGYVDLEGTVVIPFQYKKAYPFSENGLAFVVGDDGLGGYIDKYGQTVLEPIYETGSMFKFGLAAVSNDGEYKYIYQNGAKAVAATFKYASGFSDCGLAKVVTFDGKHHLMDPMSRVVLGLRIGTELEDFKDGTRITKFRAEDGREALINAAGQIFTGFFEKVVIAPYSSLHPFLRRGLWGYVNNQGEEVIPNIYKKVSPFCEDPVVKVTSFHPLAENEEVEFYINKQDEIVSYKENEKLKETFSYVGRYRKALALAVKKPVETDDIDSEQSIRDQGEHSDDEFMDEDETFDINTYVVEIDFHDMSMNDIIIFMRDELPWEYRVLEIEDHFIQFEVTSTIDFVEEVLHYEVYENDVGTYRTSKVSEI